MTTDQFLGLSTLMNTDSETTSILPKSSLSDSQIDDLLAAQLIVAWAGEFGSDDERRLRWWQTDLISEFGGQDLFERLLPHTWQWATFQAVREAARRQDEKLRASDHDPDRLLSLFSLGFDVEERTDERLQDFKRSGKSPQECLPELKAVLDAARSREAFEKWVSRRGKADYTLQPAGRRLKGKLPESLSEATSRLIAALAPIDEAYRMPHFRRES